MSVAGTYKASSDTPIGRKEVEISVFQGAAGHFGVLKTEESVYELDEVKVNGNNFSFSVNLNLPMGAVFSTFECSVHGDTLMGEVVTPFATVDVRGERV